MIFDNFHHKVRKLHLEFLDTLEKIGPALNFTSTSKISNKYMFERPYMVVIPDHILDGCMDGKAGEGVYGLKIEIHKAPWNGSKRFMQSKLVLKKLQRKKLIGKK